jgi:hypothetical protein
MLYIALILDLRPSYRGLIMHLYFQICTYMPIQACSACELMCLCVPVSASCCQLLAVAANCCQLLPITASCCQLLPVAASYCQLLPVAASCCQLVPVGASYCQLLPVAASCCQLVPVAACRWQGGLAGRKKLVARLPGLFVVG